MNEVLKYVYEVDGNDFMSAGVASADVKKNLKLLGFPGDVIKRVSIAMYEGEINMVIHANGGTATVEVCDDCITMVLADTGPGIADVELAMSEGYSTAPDRIRALGFGAGMGLPNMKKYCDEFRIETELGVGTTVFMKVCNT
ncbi:MAG: anti-sigma regulatory factor [Ruminococcaceae bacterium]|nr:anti-sigma regulatory factor [Oscillospiraceae bacterium]